MIKGKWARVWVDSGELSPRTASVELATDSAMVDTIALQETYKTSIAIGSESTLKVNGYMERLDDNNVGWDHWISRRFGVDTISGDIVRAAVMFAEDADNEAGMPCYVFPITYADSVAIATPVDNVMTINGEFHSGRGGMKRGLLLWRGNATTTGVKATLQVPAAAGTAGAQVYLFATVATGISGTATVVISSSTTSNGTFTDHATFNITKAMSAAADLTGTVNQWLRVNVTGMGGASVLGLAIIVCLNGITQPA